MRTQLIQWLVRLVIFRKLAALLARLATAIATVTASVIGAGRGLHPGLLRARWRAWWALRSSFVRHLLTNIVIGMAISLLLIYLHHIHNPWLIEFEDAGMDWMMRLYAGTSTTEKGIPIAWLDIDERTYIEWGEPLYTPRQKLRELIAFAAGSRAKAVVVDVDITRRSDNEEGDRVLLQYLNNYGKQLEAPPLILASTFRNTPGGSADGCMQVRTGFLENSSIADASGNIFWATTLFNRDSDGVIRRWRLWEPGCTEDDRPVVVPSMQLLVAAIIGAGDAQAEAAVHGLEEQLQKFAPRQCAAGQSPREQGCKTAAVQSGTVRLNGKVLDALPSHVQQRLVYSIPPDKPASGLLAGDERITPLFVRHAAYPVTNGGRQIDSSWMNGRVVIIGNSHPDARDSHATPIGEQAGALVLANAINSLLQYGQITPPAAWVKLLIEVFLILVMSVAFARFSSFWGMLVSGGTIIMFLLPVSFILFKYGVWLDFAIPLVAIQLHQMAAEFEEARCGKRNSAQ